ncbi:MAG: hypothetical protein R2824_32645 [Saprospiraceae bacterium]|nr:hypothetical protein [Lewinella sp.]
MKHLLEIVRVVTKKKVKKIEIFDDQVLRHKQSKFVEFYEAITAGKFKNDRDAAQFLYNCTPKDPRYRQLKSRFRRRLLNTVFFLDVNKPNNADYDRAYTNSHKEWAIVKILQSNKADDTAIQLARSILTTSRKFQFTDLIINCSRILRGYAAQQGDARAYEEYDEYIQEFSGVLDAEVRSEELYQKVILYYSTPITEDNDLPEKINSFSEALASLSERFESPVIFYNLYLVWIMRYELSRSFDIVLEICDRAERQINDKPAYYQEDKLVLFYTKKMSAYLHLRDFRMGQSHAEQYLKKFPEGSEPWFTFMEYYFLLAMHSDNFIQALAIFNRALDNSAFKKLDGVFREKWFIYESYINYIVERRNFSQAKLPKPKRQYYHPKRFLEDQHEYSKGQRNFEVLCTILQLLFWLEKKNQVKIEERIDQLRMLATRKLDKEIYFRPIQFIKLLHTFRKADFQVIDPMRIEKHYQPLLERPFFYRGAIAELEVIPYERLWEMVLENFD